jgi:hypothetical protein
VGFIVVFKHFHWAIITFVRLASSFFCSHVYRTTGAGKQSLVVDGSSFAHRVETHAGHSPGQRKVLGG